jgi:hypothetical protein
MMIMIKNQINCNETLKQLDISIEITFKKDVIYF